jgi:hypothetical protein
LAATLVETGIYPEEILVVSFSRAAVDVVRKRTGHVVDQGSGVDIATLDSLAARIRSELLGDGETGLRGYDNGIRRATELLSGADEPVLGGLRHLVVDEVQDVVGVRARFVLALLTHGIPADCGFTLLGDPLQSLYDFQIDRKDPIDGAAFLDEVRARFAPVERELTGEYRSRSSETAIAAASRSRFAALPPANRLAELEGIVADLPPLGDFDQDAVEDIGAWPGTTALLCDTNARAALAAETAAGGGIRVELGTDQTEAALPSWIAEFVANVPGSRLDRAGFLELAAARDVHDADEKWRLLVAVTKARGDLDPSRLADALASGIGDRRLRRESSVPVVATTVHRAKGAEFDNVVLIDSGDWVQDDDGADASSRRLFVALTRGRARLTRARGVRVRSWYKQRGTDGRPFWVKRPRGPRGGAVELILDAARARALGPVACDLAPYVGARVEWSRTEDLVDVDGREVPSWTASVDDVRVARTGEDFGVLVRGLAFNKSQVPRLTGGRVEGLETVIGPARTVGRGRHGIWQGARVVGALSLDWTVETE